MKKKSPNFSSALLSGCSLLLAGPTACDSFNTMPDYPVTVLGFASTCGRGASVKIMHDTHPNRELPNMYAEKTLEIDSQEEIEVVSMPNPTITTGPFSVKVGGFTCSFTTSNGMDLEETTCRSEAHEGGGETCLARLNLQGTRAPTLPPFNSDWQHLAEDRCEAIPPEEIFSEADVGKWRDMERAKRKIFREKNM